MEPRKVFFSCLYTGVFLFSNCCYTSLLHAASMKLVGQRPVATHNSRQLSLAAPHFSSKIDPLPHKPAEKSMHKLHILPDICLLRVGSSAATIHSGEKIKLKGLVKNNGKTDLRLVVRFTDMLHRKKLAEKTITIKAGKTVWVESTVSLTGKGRVTVVAEADPQRRIAESNERNNRATTVITLQPAVVTATSAQRSSKILQKSSTQAHVGGRSESRMAAVSGTASLKHVQIRGIKPDLSLSKLSLNKKSITLGQSVLVRIAVKNSSNTPVKNLPVALFVKKKRIHTHNITLAAFSTSTVIFRYIPDKTGTQTISAMIDPDNSISERNERNNADRTQLIVKERPHLVASAGSQFHQVSVAKTIHPIKKPDLVPTRIWVDQSTCRLWAEWKNQGGSAPKKTFIERFSLKGKFRHGSTRLKHYNFDSRNAYAIPAGYKINHEVTDLYAIVISGETDIRFTIDGTNVYSESNEQNNTMNVRVNCQPSPISEVPGTFGRSLKPAGTHGIFENEVVKSKLNKGNIKNGMGMMAGKGSGYPGSSGEGIGGLTAGGKPGGGMAGPETGNGAPPFQNDDGLGNIFGGKMGHRPDDKIATPEQMTGKVDTISPAANLYGPGGRPLPGFGGVAEGKKTYYGHHDVSLVGHITGLGDKSTNYPGGTIAADCDRATKVIVIKGHNYEGNKTIIIGYHFKNGDQSVYEKNKKTNKVIHFYYNKKTGKIKKNAGEGLDNSGDRGGKTPLSASEKRMIADAQNAGAFDGILNYVPIQNDGGVVDPAARKQANGETGSSQGGGQNKGQDSSGPKSPRVAKQPGSTRPGSQLTGPGRIDREHVGKHVKLPKGMHVVDPKAKPSVSTDQAHSKAKE